MATKTIFTVIFLVTCFTWLSDGQFDKWECPNRCHDHWMKVGDDCYRFFGRRENYYMAEKRCTRLGSHISSLRSQKESNNIYQMWKSLVDDSDSWNNAYWIGLTDRQEGNFKWEDKTDVSYMNWQSGQPDNFWNDEDCGSVYNQGDNDEDRQKWNDLSCDETRAFFCQMRMT